MKRFITTILFLMLMLSVCCSTTAATEAASDPTNQLWAMTYEAVHNWQNELDISSLNIQIDSVRTTLLPLWKEPELFFFQTYAIWGNQTGQAMKLVFYYREGFSPADVDTFEAAISQALESVLPGMDSLQAALVLHDYLALHIAYDYDNYLNGTIPKISGTAYGALVLGTAVCQGYALAYSLLLSRCGIQNTYVSSEEMNHCWNMIRIEENWYHVDLTWDDPAPNTPGLVRHKYFLLSDSAMSDAEHKHFGWQTNNVCDNCVYDANMVWSDLDSPLIFTSADTFWLLKESGDYKDQTISLLSQSWNTGDYKIAATVQDYWQTWSRNGYYWKDAYSDLVLWDGHICFNDKLHVYAYDPINETQETIYTYGGGEGYLYGLSRDGTTLKYLLKQDADQNDGTLCSVPTVHSSCAKEGL